MQEKRKKWTKRLGRLALQIVCVTVLYLGISIGMNGMYLLGVPKAEQVQKVTVSYPEVSETAKEVTDTEKIKAAVGLTNFLKYRLFTAPEASDQPEFMMTYILENGETVSVGASENTVWWHGKAHALKHEGAFMNLAEGIFYFEEVGNRVGE